MSSADRPLRVAQFGVGYTGESSVRYLLDHPGIELVGVRCYRPERAGVDVGKLVGRDPVGITTTTDVDGLLALRPDCAVFMPRDPHDDPSLPDAQSAGWLAELEVLLRAGVNVVSPIITTCHWRHLSRGIEFRDRVEQWCREGGSTVHFTGFDPGFATDALAFTMSACVGEVSTVSIWEIIDVAGYTSAPALERLGFGQDPAAFAGASPDTFRLGWGGALHLLGDALGVVVEDLGFEFESWSSPRSFVTPGGFSIAEGTIAAIRWQLSAIVDGEPRFTLQKITRAGADAAPDWPSLGTDGGYRVVIDADPPFRGDFPMGLPGGRGSTFADAMAMTAARCVNAVPAVVAARSGYVTFLDLPPLGGVPLRASARVSSGEGAGA